MVVSLKHPYPGVGRIEPYRPECSVHLCDRVGKWMSSYKTGSRKRTVILCELHAPEWAKLHGGESNGEANT